MAGSFFVLSISADRVEPVPGRGGVERAAALGELAVGDDLGGRAARGATEAGRSARCWSRELRLKSTKARSQITAVTQMVVERVDGRGDRQVAPNACSKLARSPGTSSTSRRHPCATADPYRPCFGRSRIALGIRLLRRRS